MMLSQEFKALNIISILFSMTTLSYTFMSLVGSAELLLSVSGWFIDCIRSPGQVSA